MESRHSCPECHLVFEAELPATGVPVCPLCNCSFSTLPRVDPAAIPAALSPSDVSGRQVWRGLLAVGALLLLAGGFGYSYHLLSDIGWKAAPPHPDAGRPGSRRPANDGMVSPDSVRPTPIEVIPDQPKPQAINRPVRPPERLPFVISTEPPPPLSLPESVNRAIERGLTYLRQNHPRVPQYRKYLGLLGLTLLECGVAASDTSVQQIAALIRSRKSDITQTYELTLAILFLDRLGDRTDRPLIGAFGQQLLAGQLDCGAWTYSCLVNEQRRARGNYRYDYIPPRPRITYRGDNSNTQFAILGLWVAQRHGVSSRFALLAAEEYFGKTQATDGSWSYHAKARAWRDSMTCAGLLSLAMRYGIISGQDRDIRSNHPISVNDVAIRQGLHYLAQTLDKITVDGSRIVGVEARDPLYFLWSLERMAVIYDLKKIGKHEWYPWAAQLLLQSQRPDGRWTGLGDPVSTCFALLVLKRSNFAQDLQLAVQERPSPAMPGVSGPAILQGPDAFLGKTGKPDNAPSMPPAAIHPSSSTPVGPAITRTPSTKWRE